MRVISGTATFAVIFLLAAVASGFAQAPPASPFPPLAPGFVPPYEIMRTVRAAGFDPLAPPLREGTTYVLRATDFRGILMRVVVDARTGAIRDANRIVPGPGAYDPGPYGAADMASPYSASPDMRPPPYGPAPEHGAYDMAPSGPGSAPPLSFGMRSATRSTTAPPLPRPRPADLASRKSGDMLGSGDKTQPTPGATPDPKSEVKLNAKTDVKSEVALPATPSAPSKAPVASPPLND